jgi:predicted nucleotidyltransferase
MIDWLTIQEMAGKIAERFDPEKVIVFGSYARGEAGEDSDVDLLVVVRESPPPGRRSAPIRRMLAQEYHFPIDVVVRSAGVFERGRTQFGTLAHEAAREGKVLYDKAGPRPAGVVRQGKQ